MDDLNNDTVVWRYMNLWKLVSMLDGHTLFFPRPFKFDDRWEGLFPPSYLRNARRYADENNLPFNEFEEDFRKRLKRHRCGHFVSCWHISNNESDAMWRLYGLAPEGVAIQSTVGSVKECLRPHNCGAVKYYDPADDIRSKTIFGPSDILFKRTCFSWEKEFRAWLDDDEVLARVEQNEEFNESDLSPGKLVPITDMPRLIRRLVVAPGASEAFMKTVKGVCGAYGKTWLGNLIERSSSDRLWESFTN